MGKRTIALAVAVLGCALASCSRGGDGDRAPAVAPSVGRYDDGPDGLKKLWTDILVAAQRDDRERVHDLMASMMMTEEDLVALFGDERGRWLEPRYRPMIARLVNIGAMELVSQIADRKYDDVEVFPVDEHGKEPTDRAVLAALRVKTPMYGVRVKRKNEPYGLRYDFFVRRPGRWVTGNQLGRYLVDKDPLPR